MKDLPPVGAIFAQIPNNSNNKKQSKRPLQTVEPLAKSLSIKVTGYEHSQVNQIS